MKKRTRSILEELTVIGNKKDNDFLIESRGASLIESAINLLNRISHTYDVETAAELERRFINSIKSGDSKKFQRSMQRIKESRNRNDT
jgi:hypothetical protein